MTSVGDTETGKEQRGMRGIAGKRRAWDTGARQQETDHYNNEGAPKRGRGERFPKPGTSRITKLGAGLLQGEGG